MKDKYKSVKYFKKNGEWNLKEIGVYLYPFFKKDINRYQKMQKYTKKSNSLSNFLDICISFNLTENIGR